MKRLAIFFFYDGEGIVDDYIPYFLDSLKKEGIETLFVVNGLLAPEGREKVLPLVSEVLVRENKGYDVWAYKAGLEHLGYEKIETYDEVILLNHTNFGPIFPLSEMLEAMEQRSELDFWGITKSLGNGADIPPHIQSHFIAIRKKMLQSKEFQAYWINVPEIRTFEDALYRHEFVFTKQFRTLGYRWDVYVDIQEFQGNIANPLLVYPLYCAKHKRCPILKRKSFFLEDAWLYESKLLGKMPELMEFLKTQTDYKTDLIWQNMLRTQSMRTLMKTMSLYQINSPTAPVCQSKLALVVDVVQQDNLEILLPYLSQGGMDLFLCCPTDCDCETADHIFKEKQIPVRSFTKVTALPALWQSNELLSGYDMVGYVSTAHLEGTLSDSFRLYDFENFENMLSAPGLIYHAASAFEAEGRLGMLVSGVHRNDIHQVYGWHYFYSQFRGFCTQQQVRLSKDYRDLPAYYDTDFCWVRGAALPYLWQHSETLNQQSFGPEITKFFAVEVLRTQGFFTMHQISQQQLAPVLNWSDQQEENSLEHQFQQDSFPDATAPVETKPFLKRVLDHFPRLKAFLKPIYHGLKDKLHKAEPSYAEEAVVAAPVLIPPDEVTSPSSENLETAKKPVEDTIDQQWLADVFSAQPSQTVDANHLHIAFLVPKPIKGGGGHRNIYRAVRFLAEYGHQVDVYHSDCQEELGSVTKQHISNWFYPMQENIRFISYTGEIGACDVCIACWWELAYGLKKNVDKVRFPFYLVQDYEAAFYPMSSSALMAENSYKMGFSHICSGRWCKEFLNARYQAEAAYFTFPVDHNTYNLSKPRTKKNKNIVFFAKPEMPRRCYELGIRALALVKEQRPDIEIILYGSNQISWIPCEVTMKGILPTIEDLADLYRNADLGVVFSTTNPSLVPYEMMLCGCPVVDVDMEQALMKYGNDENNVFLFDTQPDVMAQQILEIVDQKELLHQKAMAGRDWVSRTFPTEEEMGHLVEGFIKNKVTLGTMTPTRQD